MVDARDFDQGKLVTRVAELLKDKIEMPEWAQYVKTGVSRDRPPEQDNWWLMRAASILRKVSEDGPVGAERLASYYGGRQRHKHAPAHFKKGGRKVIRTILKQLEAQNLLIKIEKPKKGRVITPAGKKLLDTAIRQKV